MDICSRCKLQQAPDHSHLQPNQNFDNSARQIAALIPVSAQSSDTLWSYKLKEHPCCDIGNFCMLGSYENDGYGGETAWPGAL